MATAGASGRAGVGRGRFGKRVPFEMSVAERLLIARLKDRDEQAFNEIVRAHGDKVFSLVYRMLGNRAEAEDLAQEVFVTVFKTVDTFRSESKFSTWLLRIAANHCKNRIKYLSRRRTDAGGLDGMPEEKMSDAGQAPMQSHIDAPDVLLEAAELEQLMQQAIETLDEDHRLLIVLRDVEELSYEEIGEVSGLPEGTIKSRLHRARMTIKDYLARRTR
ncbi:MAG: sigma-70 family RNA polymerase sigma factor [Deltaproteobacteria bacterium]|nr:sigma-70 family RNA polymerase sigma factor [Deltaproteobacteria bacterium]